MDGGQGGQGRGVARRVSVQRRHRIAPPPLLPFSHRRTFQRAITVLSLHSRCLNRTRREQNRGAWPPWAVQRNSLSAALQQGRRHCSVWAEHRRKHCLRHSLLLSLWHFSIFVVDFLGWIPSTLAWLLSPCADPCSRPAPCTADRGVQGCSCDPTFAISQTSSCQPVAVAPNLGSTTGETDSH